MQPEGITIYHASGPSPLPEVVQWWDELADYGLSTGNTDTFGVWIAWDGGHAVAVVNSDGHRSVVSFPSAREARTYFDATGNLYAATVAGEDV